EVAFLLEPDLKEGRGGLRDVHALRWAEAARRILFEGDDESLAAAHRALLEVRVELQRRTGKPSDRLLLQEQDAVAAALGDADAARAATRLGRRSLDRLAAAGPPDLGDPWPDEARESLVALLRAGRAAVGVIEALDQKGLLVGLLPEWAAVRCRPQRNAYHRF